ncbi:MAG: beta-eliminating lyase-related protein [Acidobacteriota bacterium]|nr:beta-eliminating lyase-related protein [Acidobacteriota bacterium]
MNQLPRRRFLQAGSVGLGAGVLTPAAIAGGSGAIPTPATDSTRVRMTGDGLGLTPGEQGRLLARMAEEGRIERDSYSNGGVVQVLEEQFAGILGKERAVFMPTGTLANHLAVRGLAGPGGGRAIVQAEAHLYNDSGDCVQTLSAIPLIPLAPGRPTFTLEQVQEIVERTRGGRVSRPVSVISIESPVRRRSGETFDQGELTRIAAYARSEGIRLHLDGARMFLESAYTGRDVAELARPFDTVYVSLYKYFNAASGAILAGPAALLDGMFHTRRMFGSGLPAAWPFAAVALNFLPGFIERFTSAVGTSESFITEVERHGAFSVERMAGGTNLFRLRVDSPDAEAFRQRLREQQVDLGSVRADGRFMIGVNETWNRATPDDLARRFRSALA